MCILEMVQNFLLKIVSSNPKRSSRRELKYLGIYYCNMIIFAN